MIRRISIILNPILENLILKITHINEKKFKQNGM
jgi:hypothetical protein